MKANEVAKDMEIDVSRTFILCVEEIYFSKRNRVIVEFLFRIY